MLFPQVSELHDHWLYLSVTGTAPVDLEMAVRQCQRKAPVSTVQCNQDPGDSRACLDQNVPSRIIMPQGKSHLKCN